MYPYLPVEENILVLTKLNEEIVGKLKPLNGVEALDVDETSCPWPRSSRADHGGWVIGLITLYSNNLDSLFVPVGLHSARKEGGVDNQPRAVVSFLHIEHRLRRT